MLTGRLYWTALSLVMTVLLAGWGEQGAMEETKKGRQETGSIVINREGLPPRTVMAPAPLPTVVSQDFSPDYNAQPQMLLSSRMAQDGSFRFTISGATANTTNYVQVSTNLAAPQWRTIAALVPTTNTVTFVDPAAASSRQRFYRWSAVP